METHRRLSLEESAARDEGKVGKSLKNWFCWTRFCEDKNPLIYGWRRVIEILLSSITWLMRIGAGTCFKGLKLMGSGLQNQGS